MSRKKPGRQILVDRIPEKLYEEFTGLCQRRGGSMAGTIRKMLQAAVVEDAWQNEGGRFDVGNEYPPWNE